MGAPQRQEAGRRGSAMDPKAGVKGCSFSRVRCFAGTFSTLIISTTRALSSKLMLKGELFQAFRAEAGPSLPPGDLLLDQNKKSFSWSQSA